MIVERGFHPIDYSAKQTVADSYGRAVPDDPDQAAEKALSKARAKGYELDWTLSDSPCSDPYLGDDEEDVQLVDEPCPVNRRPKSTCPDGCSHGT